MAALSDYKFTGYGIISQGSSVKMFMGIDQQFFLGGKNAMSIGTSNTFTAGIKADVMVGPAVSMSLGPDWNKTVGDKATGGIFGSALQWGHLLAKYDFSTNKNFAFHIAHEGSSNYVTQSKFMCTTGFVAVGGFQPAGEAVYKTYTNTIHGMGKWAALTNFLMAFTQIAQTIEAPAPKDEKDKGELKDDNTRQLWAKIIPGVVAGASSSFILSQAILAAIERESNFKSFLHPQSVIDLTKTSVFLGALGNGLDPTQTDGASLTLAKGKATLGSRTISFDDYLKPYADKFDSFKSKPTAALAVDPNEIRSYANFMSIAAGGIESSNPAAVALQNARKAYDKSISAAKTAGEVAYKGLTEPLIKSTEAAQVAAGEAAREAALKTAMPAILTARAALITALSYYKANPTLFLSAGSDVGSALSKIEATAPNFNVIAPNISLAANSTPASRGVFFKSFPKPSIEIVQATTNKIVMDMTGSISLTANPNVSLKLKPDSIVVQMGANTLTLSAIATTMKSGSTKIECSMGMVKVGSALKIMG